MTKLMIASPADITLDEIADATGMTREQMHHQCHATSIALVKSGLIFERLNPRVARGFCEGVGSQHSWVILGGDCYSETATIIDPTLWSYDPSVPDTWVGNMRIGKRHVPHGSGHIFRDGGCPPAPCGPVVELAVELGPKAKAFMKLAAPIGLDHRGWGILAHQPVGGWPAGEIFAAMDDTPKLKALVPIDILGMVTDRNPSGLYLPSDVVSA
jgi:hypothetical protein